MVLLLYRLCSAAFADNLFELQHLVENGIDANSGDYDHRTGWWRSGSTKDASLPALGAQVLRLLVCFLAALHLGACEGNSKIVEFLLLPMSKGDPNVVDRWGVSPLLDAIKHG